MGIITARPPTRKFAHAIANLFPHADALVIKDRALGFVFFSRGPGGKERPARLIRESRSDAEPSIVGKIGLFE